MNKNRRQFIKNAVVCSTVLTASVALGQSKSDFTFEELLINFSKSWKRSKTYLLEISEAMPAKDYNFRPVPEIRTFAEQILHLSSSIYDFSALIKGEKNPVLQTVFDAKGKSKSQIVEILNQALNYATSAIEDVTEQGSRQTIQWGGRLYENSTEMPIFGVIRVLHDHTTHHRGQLVVYLRLKGIEPPTYVD